MRDGIRGRGLALVLLALGCQRAVTTPPTELFVEPTGDQCAVAMQVTGMDCAVDCPTRIYDALSAVDGVVEAAISYPAKRVWVLADATGCTEEAVEQMPVVVSGLGFEASVLKVTRGR